MFHGEPSGYPTAPIPQEHHLHQYHSGESDHYNARRNELYHVGPHKGDGLYHCPFENSENCKHKPEKVKCNYM